MSFAPEDPRRPEEETFHKRLMEARARVFELAYAHCMEVRELLAEAKVEDMKTEEKASRLQLKAVQLEHTDGMTMRVIVGVSGGTALTGKKEIVIADNTERNALLRPRPTRSIFRMLEDEHRETIAEYVGARGYEEAADDFDDIEQRAELEAMHELIDRLKERILHGELPVPRKPLPWGEGYGSPWI